MPGPSMKVRTRLIPGTFNASWKSSADARQQTRRRLRTSTPEPIKYLMSESKLPPPRPIIRFAADMPVPAATERSQAPAPRLSVVVVAYAMAEQVDRTLHSLSLNYQRGVSKDDYEVILVENASGDDLGEARATSHSGNFRYFLREETESTPIHAINFGAAQARGEYVAIMIDGARMLSPGVIAWTLAASRLDELAVVCVPGYHLGEELQQVAAHRGYNEATEAELLESISWPEDGYRLFEISCSAGTSAGGFFKPIGESNCIALPKTLFEELGGFDSQFTQRGGGMVNLDFYKRALDHPGSQLVILPGEGSFHQFHGGETTGRKGVDREQIIQDIAEIGSRHASTRSPIGSKGRRLQTSLRRSFAVYWRGSRPPMTAK